jgi:DNA (cytosine-5)-methyltransferase 1
MNGLAICAGVGGIELGLKLALGNAYRCVGYIERQAYAVSTLVGRMEEEALDRAPVWDDVGTFDGKPWRGLVDLIAAGIPCQPWSSAGEQKGKLDERWIWRDVLRVIQDVEPGLVFLENVPGIIQEGLPQIVGDLSKNGFTAAWDCFSACEVGASHPRKRLFLLAHAGRERLEGIHETGWDLHLQSTCEVREKWEAEPKMDRVALGIPDRVEQLIACGNGVVPLLAAFAFRSLAKTLAVDPE